MFEYKGPTANRQCFNRKIGQMHITYLGLPISDKTLGSSAFKYIPDKLKKKLQQWKGKKKHVGQGGDWS